MHKITQKIINYTKAKYSYTHKKWHLGLSDNPKETRKEFEIKYKIVCAYFKTWPCKNKTEAKRILKEANPADFIICKKTPKPIIFTFLAIDQFSYKSWKILNTQKPEKFLILK